MTPETRRDLERVAEVDKKGGELFIVNNSDPYRIKIEVDDK